MDALFAALLIVCSPVDSGMVMRKDSTMRSMYHVEAAIVGSVQATRYVDKPTPFSNVSVFPGTNFSGRLMWHPDHLLAVGLYTGFITFSRENITVTDANGARQDLTLDLTGIPAQVVVAMQPGHFEFGVGIGVYFLTAHTSVNNTERFSSSDHAYGVSGWFGYNFNLTEAITLGPEVGLHVLSNIGITSGIVGIRIRMDLLTY